MITSIEAILVASGNIDKIGDPQVARAIVKELKLRGFHPIVKTVDGKRARLWTDGKGFDAAGAVAAWEKANDDH